MLSEGMGLEPRPLASQLNAQATQFSGIKNRRALLLQFVASTYSH